MRLAEIATKYEDELEKNYGNLLMPGHRRALRSIIRCRTPECGSMLAGCPSCGKLVWWNHSCGHRNCPQCQHHETSRWLERQREKLLPVRYFLVTFTLPFELRNIVFSHQRKLLDLLFRASSETLREAALNERYLGGTIGMTGVLHTHSRRLDYHPHVHYIVPAGCIDKARNLWKRKSWRFLFPVKVLSGIFKRRFLEFLKSMGFDLPAGAKRQAWVVHSQDAGRGEPALKYLSTYLYRGIISEKRVKMKGNDVSFEYLESASGERKFRTMPGAHFLYLILKHVLPKGFRRVRDFGFLHGKARRTLMQIQLLLHARINPSSQPTRPVFNCPDCGHSMILLLFNVTRSHRSAFYNKGSPTA